MEDLGVRGIFVKREVDRDDNHHSPVTIIIMQIVKSNQIYCHNLHLGDQPRIFIQWLFKCLGWASLNYTEPAEALGPGWQGEMIFGMDTRRNHFKNLLRQRSFQRNVVYDLIHKCCPCQRRQFQWLGCDNSWGGAKVGVPPISRQSGITRVCSTFFFFKDSLLKCLTSLNSELLTSWNILLQPFQVVLASSHLDQGQAELLEVVEVHNAR